MLTLPTLQTITLYIQPLKILQAYKMLKSKSEEAIKNN